MLRQSALGTRLKYFTNWFDGKRILGTMLYCVFCSIFTLLIFTIICIKSRKLHLYFSYQLGKSCVLQSPCDDICTISLNRCHHLSFCCMNSFFTHTCSTCSVTQHILHIDVFWKHLSLQPSNPLLSNRFFFWQYFKGRK